MRPNLFGELRRLKVKEDKLLNELREALRPFGYGVRAEAGDMVAIYSKRTTKGVRCGECNKLFPSQGPLNLHNWQAHTKKKR